MKEQARALGVTELALASGNPDDLQSGATVRVGPDAAEAGAWSPYSARVIVA